MIQRYTNNPGTGDLVSSFEIFLAPFSEDREFSQTVSLIYLELKTNDQPFFDKFGFFQKVTRAEVKLIISTYINKVKGDNTFPEYNDKYNADAQKNETIINQIAKLSNLSSGKVSRTLKQLYWSTVQGRVGSYEFIFPRTGKEVNDIVQPPEEYKASAFSGITSGITGTVTLLGKVVEYLPYIIIVGGGAAILFFGSNIVKNVKEITD